MLELKERCIPASRVLKFSDLKWHHEGLQKDVHNKYLRGKRHRKGQNKPNLKGREGGRKEGRKEGREGGREGRNGGREGGKKGREGGKGGKKEGRELNCRRTSQPNMASKVALLLFFVLEHTKWSLAFAARRLGRKIQKVFCPIRSEYLLGCLELVRSVFVPRGSYFSFLLFACRIFSRPF